MARVDGNGVQAVTLSGYVDLLNGVFRSALGSDLDISPETAQGQLIGVLASLMAEIDDSIVHVSNGLSLEHATGRQLEDLCSAMGVSRYQAARTTVAATLTGTANLTVAAGTLASTSTHTFELTSAVDLGSSGSAQGTFRALEYGNIPCPPGALDTLRTQITGLESVLNTAGPTSLGRTRESDRDYRIRYRKQLNKNQFGSLRAMRASLEDVAGVTRVKVIENATPVAVTNGGLTIAASSFMPIVEGGTDNVIAAQIALNKPLGIQSVGAASGTFAGTTYNFQRVVSVPVSITIETTGKTDFPTDGVTRMKNRLIDFIDDLGIGNGTSTVELYGPLYQVAGHTVTSVAIARTDTSDTAGVATADLTAATVLTTTAPEISITVN